MKFSELMSMVLVYHFYFTSVSQTQGCRWLGVYWTIIYGLGVEHFEDTPLLFPTCKPGCK